VASSNFSVKDLSLFSELDLVYNKMRHLQANHDQLRTGCKGSGHCCRVGLMIPMLECANIAFHLKREFYLKMERYGIQSGEEWFQGIIDGLIAKMYDEEWSHDGGSGGHCVFYKDGCTIYEYRPLVCRAYGTIVAVDDFCPRDRLEGGGIDIFGGQNIAKIVKEFDSVVRRYSLKHKEHKFVSYMPLGILYFLLPPEGMTKLFQDTDPKFWNGASIYKTYFMERYLDTRGAKKKSDST
jgi:Fe-S-cluster containining protein